MELHMLALHILRALLLPKAATTASTFTRSYTTQSLQPYSSHVARSITRCASICDSDNRATCTAYTYSDDGMCGLLSVLSHDLLYREPTLGATLVYTRECPTGYRLNPYAGTCLRFVHASIIWDAAKSECEGSEEYLATFTSEESALWFQDQQLNRGWISSSKRSWLGGLNVGGTFIWQGIETGPVNMAIQTWYPGQPDGFGPCMVSFGAHQSWGDNPCTNLRAYTCEKYNY